MSEIIKFEKIQLEAVGATQEEVKAKLLDMLMSEMGRLELHSVMIRSYQIYTNSYSDLEIAHGGKIRILIKKDIQ